MAAPMTFSELITQLNKWGVDYAPYKNWATHNRNHVGKWGPVHGFAWHHTGSDATDQRELLYNGYQGLPGPLCHFGVSQLGIVHLIGWGRANHAGLGDDDVLAALIAERNLPVDDEANTDGNSRLYGAEFWYSGNHPMTSPQYNAGILLSAAICDFHDWDGASILGHGEWQPGKWDPGYAKGKMMNLDVVRTDIDRRLEIGPPKMAEIGKDVPEKKPSVYVDTWKTDAMAVPDSAKAKEGENKYWEAETMLRYAAEQAAQANANTRKIMKHLGIK